LVCVKAIRTLRFSFWSMNIQLFLDYIFSKENAIKKVGQKFILVWIRIQTWNRIWTFSKVGSRSGSATLVLEYRTQNDPDVDAIYQLILVLTF
jgi:hypothetical protein